MIIKHLVELETVINEKSNEPAVKIILAMGEEERNNFFQKAGQEMISDFAQMANKDNTWAELRVVKKVLV
jgi:hypothetical protein